MSNDTKSPAPKTPEPQQITPQTGELDAEKLDEISGGVGGAGGGAAPHSSPVGPQGP